MVKEVYMEIEAWRKMMAFARLAAPKEIIGYLYGEEKDGAITISDIILPKQEVTGCHCEVIIDKTITDIEHPENIKGWWHSHHTMGSFQSGEDKDTLNNFGADGVKYTLSIIVSLPNTVKAWVKYFKPIEIDPVEVPVAYLWPDAEALETSCKALIDEKVSEKKWAPPTHMATVTGGAGGVKPAGETGSAEDWQKGELAETIVEDLACSHRETGRRGIYCEIFGRPLICGSEKCKKARAKFGQRNSEQGIVNSNQGCSFSYGNFVVKDGIEGCLWQGDFQSCADCGLFKLERNGRTEMA